MPAQLQQNFTLRVTNSQLHQRIQHDLQRGLASMQDAYLRATTGKRIATPSDDPARAAEIMTADRRLRSLEQYRRNIDSGSARLASAEGVLDQLTDLLSRARELGLAQGGDTADAAARQAAKVEVDQIIETVIQLGNTRFGGGYLFGGAFADSAPLAADGSVSATQPPVGETPVPIDEGQSVLTVQDAQSVFIDSGMIVSLRQLSTALGAGDAAGIRGAVSSIVTSFNATQDRLGEVGARAHRLEVAGANAEALGAAVRTYRSDLSDVEIDEAITELLSRQTAFEAALMATSRIMSTTLTDYLR